jgi:hypothetical protein
MIKPYPQYTNQNHHVRVDVVGGAPGFKSNGPSSIVVIHSQALKISPLSDT